MARGRMVSKSLGVSRKFARLRAEHPTIGLFAQVLYVLLVANSDDFGRQQADAFTVKHGVFPTAPEDELAFHQALDAMRQVLLIDRYEVDGETYLQIKDFSEYQWLSKRTASKFPEPPDDSENLPGTPYQLHRTETAVESESVQLERFERFWASYPRQQGKEAAWSAWLDIGPDAALTDQIVAGIELYRATKTCVEAIASGDPQYILTPRNWLRDRHWNDVLTTNASTKAPTTCRHRHTPPCPDDTSCTARYLADLREVAS